MEQFATLLCMNYKHMNVLTAECLVKVAKRNFGASEVVSHDLGQCEYMYI